MLRFNTFRAKKYLRSKFVEGKFLLASEATDLELELIDLLRTQLKNSLGDFAVEDSWKVTRVNATQLLVLPGEAWLEGLPFLMRYGKDHLVSGNLLSSGITPQFVTITDDANGGGKLITFNVGGSTPTDIYKVVITAQEQVLTDNDDLFLKNANLTEDTAQKIRLIYKINVVSNSLQQEAPIPYTNENNQANLVNRIVVSPTPGGNGELLNTTLITGSEEIDGRNVELTVRNDSGIGGGNPIPNGSSDQQSFFNGRLIDSNGTEYHLNAIFNATLSTQVVLRVSHEVGQNPPELINGKPYSLRKRDVFVSDDVNGTPQGKLFYSTALVDFNSVSGVESDSKVTDLRKTDDKDPDFESETNQKVDFYITNGGTLSLDATSTLLSWSANLDIINAYGAEQTIAPNTAALLDGGTLTYEVNFAGGAIGRGNQSVTIGTGGSTLLLTGSPDLSQMRIGNVIQASGQFAAITAIDNVNKTLTVSPSVSNTGSATVYRDSFASGTAPLATKSIVVAVRDGLQVKVAKSLILNAGDSSPLGGASPLIVRQNKNAKLIKGGTWTNIPGSNVYTLVSQQATENNRFSLDSSVERLAQPFTPGTSGNLGKVTLYPRKVGTASGTFVVNILADASGLPGSVLASSSPISISSLPTSFPAPALDITFASPPAVVASTQYWIQIDASGATLAAFNTLDFNYGNPSPYVYFSSDSGASYAIQSSISLEYQAYTVAVGAGSQLSWTADAYIQIPGLTDGRNTIPLSASPITLANDDDVAYVDVNRTPGGNVNLSILVAQASSLVLDDNTMVIARKTGLDVIVGTSSFSLEQNESKPLDEGISDQTLSLLGSGITRSTASPTYASNIRGVASEGFKERLGSLTDSAGDGQEDRSTFMRSDIPITWTGTSLQFQTDIIIEVINTKSGVTTIHTIPFSVVSPLALANGESAWVSINRLAASETLTVNKSTITPIPAQTQANKDVLVLFKRVDATGVGYLHIPLSKQVINPGQTVRLGASGTGGGGSGLGDDITSLFFNADFTDLFDELPLASSPTLAINIAAGFTDPTLYSVVNQYYRLAYDASKTVTGSSVNMVLSSAPSFTVKAGDILVVGGEARKIVTATSQTIYVIESAFVNIPSPSAQSCTVSEALYTKDINQFAGDGLSQFAVNAAPFQTLLVKYTDSLTDGDKIPDYGVVPHVGYTASVDGTNYTPVVIRKQNATDTLDLLNTPTSGTNLFLRFFANKASGSGFVNLLNYKAYWQEDPSVTNSGAVLNSAYTRGDGLGTQVNCLPPVLIGGNTRIRLLNFTYPVGLMPESSIEVLINGQDVDRFIDPTTTPNAAFIEVDPSTVDLVGDYTATDLSIKIRVPVPILDSGDNNTQSLNAIQEILQENFQNIIDKDDNLLVAFNGAPGQGQFRSQISNRASIIDPSKDLALRMGIDRLMYPSLILTQSEYGPNGESVFSALNDKYNQLRFVGSWVNGVTTTGPTPNPTAVDDFIEIVFYGTGLNLLHNPYLSLSNNTDLRVSVDGAAEGSNIVVANFTNVIINRNYNENVITKIVSGLSLGLHTVKIRVNAGPIFFAPSGFEVLNEASQLKVSSGKGFVNGRQLIHPIFESLAYNSSFESGSLGSRGGRVVVYLKPDGTVAKAVTPTNVSQQNLTAANHANEDVIRQYYYREFGAGRSDDFSTLAGTQSARAHALSDNTTNLVTSSAIASTYQGNPTPLESLVVTNNGTDFIIFTFVGTGLDVLLSANAASTLNNYVWSVDGLSIGSMPLAGLAGKTSLQKVVSGLPFGTHTVTVKTDATGGEYIGIARFLVYGPKKPVVPNGAMELGEYSILANYVANTVGGLDTIGTGVIRKHMNREMTYVGASFGNGGVNATAYLGGNNVFNSGIGDYHELVFYGTGFELRNYITPSSTSSVTVSVDGLTLNSTNYPSVVTSTYGNNSFTFATGILNENNTTAFGNGFTASGLSLGLHTVRFTNNTTGFMEHNALDIISPIYAPKITSEMVLQNEFVIGNQSIGDSRHSSVHPDLPENKHIAQAKGISNPNTTSSTFVPIPDMGVAIKVKSNKIKIDWTTTAYNGGGAIEVSFQVFVDGVLVGPVHSNAYANQLINHDSIIVPVSPGYHYVTLYWKTVGSTAQMFDHDLIVEEM